jgi:hypothetical protein
VTITDVLLFTVIDMKKETIMQIIKDAPLNTQDEFKFGDIARQKILQSPELFNADGDFALLKQFITDEINFLNIECDYLAKYINTVYHPNTIICRKYEIELLEAISRKLFN